MRGNVTLFNIGVWVQHCSLQSLATLLRAYAKLNFNPGSALLSEAANAALAGMPNCKSLSVTHILWALATLKHHPGALLLDAAAQRQLLLIKVGVSVHEGV